MATSRPVVSIYKHDKPSEKAGTVTMPTVLCMPLRPDLVADVHKDMSKNKRQAHAVGDKVGYGTAAESWGTGRAVARIPRAPGGGTHRAGQAAFGNQARKGGMAHPLKVWRRWHRRVNVTKKRHAVVTALAASTLPPLVMARGHRVGQVSELPLVVSNGLESVSKTKQAVEFLKGLGCGEELQKVVDSKKLRAGKGKLRSKRYRMRRGPLVIYSEDNGITKAMRNIPGVECAHVDRLNLLQLAPGGHFGRFCIWTEGAFKRLNEIYGTAKSGAPMKKGYHLPRSQMENADLARIINSNEIQSVLRPKLEAPKRILKKRNPLKNKQMMARLNPGVLTRMKSQKRSVTPGTKEYERKQRQTKARVAASRKYNKEHKRGDNTFIKKMMNAFATKAEEKEE